MRKRIQIRKAILVTAFAAVLGGAMVTPAVAYQADDRQAQQSNGCNVNPQALRADPQMCSRQVFSDFTKETVSVRSTAQESSSPIQLWTIYPLAGAVVLLAATKLIRSRHNRPRLAA